MSQIKSLLAASLLVLLVQIWAPAQNESAPKTADVPSPNARTGGDRQVEVYAIVYAVRERDLRRLSRLYPELMIPPRAGAQALRRAPFNGRLQSAIRAGLVRVLSIPRGIVREGNTFDLAANMKIFGYGSPVPEIEVERRVQITLELSEDAAGGAVRLQTYIDFRMDSLGNRYDRKTGLPDVHHLWISTKFSSKSDEVVVLGGMRLKPEGRVFVAYTGRIVDTNLSARARTR